ncbi:MAG: D-glycero-beta-D-manno-heptose-7-phosphate kinase [Bacteroidetes bacterium]|nr:D-glycero-beta-D-manno-heptose-7-phosphate kinase [Bacteroidota bacterium]
MQKTDYEKLFDSFNHLNVLIIGDVMVDSYIWGQVNRISPEAPVPIVAVKKRENRLGGAANVALNIKSLGANPVLCSVVGNDPKGKEIIELLQTEGMETAGIVESNQRITTTKFRVIGNKMQLLRVDEEDEHELSSMDQETLLQRFDKLLKELKIEVIIFQDYDKGVINADVINHVVANARQLNIPVAVDPKKNNFLDYKGVTLFKPNLKELSEGLNTTIDPEKVIDLKAAAAELRKKLNMEFILITLSEHGIYVDLKNENENQYHILPSNVRAVSDVSGAGDTVISVASVCLALRTGAEDLAFIANLAGGQVCEKVGVVPVDKARLLNEILRLKC